MADVVDRKEKLGPDMGVIADPNASLQAKIAELAALHPKWGLREIVNEAWTIMRVIHPDLADLKPDWFTDMIVANAKAGDPAGLRARLTVLAQGKPVHPPLSRAEYAFLADLLRPGRLEHQVQLQVEREFLVLRVDRLMAKGLSQNAAVARIRAETGKSRSHIMDALKVARARSKP
jgi:hypothetical protein